jgi:NAD(P)-dependent dehydrogenase (short-subunit alcohol dehydrogenase family)
MGRLDGRVAIVTGAGRGLGREHSLALAAEGASVVVNDLGGDVHGAGASPSAAMAVVAEIEAAGGHATVSGHDVSDWEQARQMVALAIKTFGRLDVLVNNAGIVRDRTLANLSEADWDAVTRVHLKGHVAPTRHAVAYWRARAKSGEVFDASVIMTSSLAGLAGNFGQANYATAKLGVIALSRVVAIEAGSYGVRSNAVSPGGRTRISMTMPGAEEAYAQAASTDGFDEHDPGNVSPLIVWLAGADCPASSQVFHLSGDRLVVSAMPPILHEARLGRRWTIDDFDKELTPWLLEPISLSTWAGVEE